jgi:phosphoserine phosphatase RsbU/P
VSERVEKSARFAFLAAICWLLCMTLDAEWARRLPVLGDCLEYVQAFFLTGFTFFCFLFYRNEIGRSYQVVDLLDLLWRSFITSIVCFGLVFLIRLADIGNNLLSFIPADIILYWSYYFYVASIVIFQANLFYIFKNLASYPKISSQEKKWHYVEIFMIALVVLGLVLHDTGEYSKMIGVGVSALVTLVFATRLKWVAYLTLRQKGQAIMLITSVLLMGLFFLQLFLGGEIASKKPYSISSNFFYHAQFTFLGVYAVLALLMLLFNLPTSSLFDKRTEDMGRFRMFSEALQNGTDKKDVIEQLLNGAMAISLADAVWVEYVPDEGATEIFVKKMETAHLSSFKKALFRGQPLDESMSIVREVQDKELMDAHSPEMSMLSFPLRTSKNKFGHVGMVKYTRDGFERDIISVLKTYTQQASISLENMVLLSEAIEKERYLEEIKISKRVQKSLLPKQFLQEERIQIACYAKSEGAVGGDFYDFFSPDNKIYWVAIGDVAGKGTAAAFLMAQLKGVFRALVQTSASPLDFMGRANKALVDTMERTAFITLSVFCINTEKRTYSHVRAGHCPALFSSASSAHLQTMEPKGIGLGLVKDDSFLSYIEEANGHYQIGDAFYLYTDGVIESKNDKGDIVGTDELAAFLSSRRRLPTEELIQQFDDFMAPLSENATEEDDITFMAMRLG